MTAAHIVQLLSSKIVYFCDKSMKLCMITTSHGTNNRVVCLVAWPLNESEAGIDLVLIETSLLFLC